MLLPVSALGGASPSPLGAERIHEVRAGETLSGIAKLYSVTVAALVDVNKLAGATVTLRIGQRLKIPAVVARTSAQARAAARPGRVVLRPPSNLTLALPDSIEQIPLFAWPVEGPISSPFGRRRSGWHRGIDIKADLGVPVVASAAGVVVGSGYERRYGRVIKIEHAHGFITVYAHNDENMVEIGDRVFAGQRIAVVGRTGRATAHHLHFEIRQAGLAYNPLYMLPLPRRVALVEETDEEAADHDE
jgi:murein DD-endopeptidase MepM/ murein hydrolase activator NlpD